MKLSTGVAKIDKNAFGSCSALQEIQVAKDNPNFSSLNGVLYSKKITIIYPAAKTDAAYIIPSGVTSVAMYAFSENPYLETLTIPNSLIKVGDSAFYNCKNLRAVSYNGTEEEWNQITIGLLNEKLTGATIQYQERIIGINADGAFTISDVVLQ
ncbi:MAG: leucine-rich repeat protein [Ruminococcus callidus]